MRLLYSRKKNVISYISVYYAYAFKLAFICYSKMRGNKWALYTCLQNIRVERKSCLKLLACCAACLNKQQQLVTAYMTTWRFNAHRCSLPRPVNTRFEPKFYNAQSFVYPNLQIKCFGLNIFMRHWFGKCNSRETRTNIKYQFTRPVLLAPHTLVLSSYPSHSRGWRKKCISWNSFQISNTRACFAC